VNPILILVPALIAAIVSISIVFLGRRSETRKHLESLRTTAYVDFVRGVAGLAVLQKRPDGSREEFLKGNELIVLVADAKARIALYGSKSVVSSLAKFLRGGVVLDTPERGREFTAICKKMRTDTRPRLANVKDDDAHFLLFGLDPDSYLNSGDASTLANFEIAGESAGRVFLSIWDRLESAWEAFDPAWRFICTLLWAVMSCWAVYDLARSSAPSWRFFDSLFGLAFSVGGVIYCVRYWNRERVFGVVGRKK
jgi:hypothetical protein